MTVVQHRYVFRPLDEVRLAARAGNTLRGALGVWSRKNDPGLFQYCFQMADSGDATLRPFIIRANHLSSSAHPPGELFGFSAHLFWSDEEFQVRLSEAFKGLFIDGAGLGRGRAKLLEIERYSTPINLAETESAQTIRVDFVSPTELKNQNGIAAEFTFELLFRRILGRLNRLKAKYGQGYEAPGNRALLSQANSITITNSALTHVDVRRRSTRTGQTHPAGGMTGNVTYTGRLAGFVPYLRAAELIGVGRQTTWGNGELAMVILD